MGFWESFIKQQAVKNKAEMDFNQKHDIPVRGKVGLQIFKLKL
jgi:hypothetical protein